MYTKDSSSYTGNDLCLKCIHFRKDVALLVILEESSLCSPKTPLQSYLTQGNQTDIEYVDEIKN